MSIATETDRQSWLAERQNGIGASEAAAAIGISPWMSPFQLWSEKTGLAEPPDLTNNEAVEFGVRLERPICDAFSSRTGRASEPWPQHKSVKHSAVPFLFCTPDALQWYEARSGKGTLQIKTTSAWNASEWEEGPPLHYQVQAQTELAVLGAEWGSICVLIGGQKLRYFDFERNDKFITALIPKLQEFWTCVQTRTPPEVDSSFSTAKVLMRLHPEDSGEEVTLPIDSSSWTADIEAAKQAIEDAEERKRLAENRIKAALGDATFGLLPDGTRWSWKTQERAGHEVRASKFRVLRKLSK